MMISYQILEAHNRNTQVTPQPYQGKYNEECIRKN